MRQPVLLTLTGGLGGTQFAGVEPPMIIEQLVIFPQLCCEGAGVT